jgi:preprotein translocase subunit SecA/nephrocystin-3
MVRQYLDKTYRKHLEDTQLERIVDDPQNVNTLVLKTLLDEVANFGNFNKLGEKIEDYLKPDSIGDFYQAVLQNYEADFGEDRVRHFLSLIAVSRNGLSEDEILEITGIKDTPLFWSQFFCSFRQHMVVKNGLISFSHNYIREAVEERYINSSPLFEHEVRLKILDYMKRQDVSDYVLHELAFQYDKLEMDEDLHSLMTNPRCLLFFAKNDWRLMSFSWQKWSYRKMFSFSTDLKEMTSDDDSWEYRDCLAVICRNFGSNNDFLDLSEWLLNKASGKQQTFRSLFRISQAYKDADNKEEFLKRANDTYSFALDAFGDKSREASAALNLVGLAYDWLEDRAKAIECFRHSYSIEKEGIVLYNLAIVYYNQQSYKDAVVYGKQALSKLITETGEENYYVWDCYSLISLAYKESGEKAKSIEFAEKELKSKQRYFGEVSSSSAYMYRKLCKLYADNDEYVKAVQYKEKELSIIELIHQKGYVSDIFYSKLASFSASDLASLTSEVGVAYESINDLKKAAYYYSKVLDLFLSEGKSAERAIEYMANVRLAHFWCGYRKVGESFTDDVVGRMAIRSLLILNGKMDGFVSIYLNAKALFANPD